MKNSSQVKKKVLIRLLIATGVIVIVYQNCIRSADDSYEGPYASQCTSNCPQVSGTPTLTLTPTLPGGGADGSCQYNGMFYKNEEFAWGYEASSATQTSPCRWISRKCVNGNLNGALYPGCSPFSGGSTPTATPTAPGATPTPTPSPTATPVVKYRIETTIVTASGNNTNLAVCPATYRVVGGGYRSSFISELLTFYAVGLNSYPNSAANGWTVSMGDFKTYEFYAICMRYVNVADNTPYTPNVSYKESPIVYIGDKRQGSAIATCDSGTVLLGGGHQTIEMNACDPVWAFIWQDRALDSASWISEMICAKQYKAYAICLSPPPSGQQIYTEILAATQDQTPVNLTCSASTKVTGGGFETVNTKSGCDDRSRMSLSACPVTNSNAFYSEMHCLTYRSQAICTGIRN